MIGPRWRKVWRDLWIHKLRTLLAVLSIAIGVFAIGMTAGTRRVLATDLAAAYASINPASASIQTLVPFDRELVDVVANMDGVRDAQGRTSLMVRMRAAGSDWRNLQLISVPDYDDIRIDQVRPDTGKWPPPDREILIERSGLGPLGVAVGDEIEVRMPGRSPRTLRVAGTAHDLYALIYTIDGLPWAFVTATTMEWLGAEPGITELRILADEGLVEDRDAVADLAREVRDKVEKAKAPVFLMSLPEPGKHPLDSTIQTVLLILGALGALSLLMGALLVTNTISALLAEEVRAIGMMKAVGATRGQLMGMYGVLVLCFGMLALGVGLPLGMIGTAWLSKLMASYLNFDLLDTSVSSSILVLQILVGLAVPLLASSVPILKGTRVTVREAISEYGLGKGQFGTGRIDHLLERIRGLSRPMLLSLRNTFRRKARLGLTLTTLAIGSAIFLSIFNVRAAALGTLDAIMGLFQYDLLVQLSQPQRVEHLVREAHRVPGVVHAEPWGWGMGHWPDEEGAGGIYYGYALPLAVWAPPADTKQLKPTLLEGRWLLPEDENALVVNTKVLSERPGLDVGDNLELSTGGKEIDFRVVGVVRDIGLMPMVYANYPFYARAMNEVGRASTVAVVLDSDDAASQSATARALEDHFGNVGLKVSMVSRAQEEMEEAEAVFNIVLVLLVVMGVILAAVGGLGLMGAMSLNVIERTREIGVMRAIGASDGALVAIFVAEGVLTGVLSWLGGVVIALPVSKLLSDAAGRALLDAPLGFTFSWRGAFLWLGVVVVIAGLASLIPALRAARISVRETLAYE